MTTISTTQEIQNQAEKKKYRWKVSFTVLLLFIFGAIINMPFSREVKNLAIEAGKKDITLNESIFSELLTIGISGLILGSILVFIGLWVSSNANLGAPLIARYFSNKPMSEIIDREAILSSIFLSVIIALILLVLFEIQSDVYPVPNKLPRPSKLYYLIVAFSAGITEEIMFRLGLMSFIVTVIHSFKSADNPGNGTVWAAIIISALFFGLMHLPLSNNFVDLTPFTLAVTMLGNLITGSTFGWIFWKRGLLVAILSHIVFDLVFHVIGSPYS